MLGKHKKWLDSYQHFLLKNSSQISSIESSLRSLTFILPGQFKDAEIASESCKYLNPARSKRKLMDFSVLCPPDIRIIP
jgi:hypothetical protein